MKRTKRLVKKVPLNENSFSSEDDEPLQPKPLKKSVKDAAKIQVNEDNSSKNINGEDSSSSESDIENYLQRPEDLDLNSTFFKPLAKPSTEATFAEIEKNIFAGVDTLSDCDESDDEEMTVEDSNTNKDKKVVKKSKKTTLNFQQLHDYTKKIEEAKLHVEKYLATKKQNNEAGLDVSTILQVGEGNFLDSSDLQNTLHSSDFDSESEDEKGDWEEVKNSDLPKAHKIPKEGLQITLKLPDTVRKKKGIDLVAVLKRRLNRIRKENQIYVHKVHMLCWIAHGNYINETLNKENLLGIALSLLPSENCYPSNRTDLKYLEQIVNWYKRSIKNVEKVTPKNMNLEKNLHIQMSQKTAYNKKMYVYIFICILRSLGIQCRLVLSLQIEPLRPPASELNSLSTKEEKKDDKEASTSPYFKKSPAKKEGFESEACTSKDPSPQKKDSVSKTKKATSKDVITAEKSKAIKSSQKKEPKTTKKDTKYSKKEEVSESKDKKVRNEMDKTEKTNLDISLKIGSKSKKIDLSKLTPRRLRSKRNKDIDKIVASLEELEKPKIKSNEKIQRPKELVVKVVKDDKLIMETCKENIKASKSKDKEVKDKAEKSNLDISLKIGSKSKKIDLSKLHTPRRLRSKHNKIETSLGELKKPQIEEKRQSLVVNLINDEKVILKTCNVRIMNCANTSNDDFVFPETLKKDVDSLKVIKPKRPRSKSPIEKPAIKKKIIEENLTVGRPKRAKSKSPIIMHETKKIMEDNLKVGPPKRAKSKSPIIMHKTKKIIEENLTVGRPKRAASKSPIIIHETKKIMEENLTVGRPKRAKSKSPIVIHETKKRMEENLTVGRPKRATSKSPIIMHETKKIMEENLTVGRPKRAKSKSPIIIHETKKIMEQNLEVENPKTIRSETSVTKLKLKKGDIIKDLSEDDEEISFFQDRDSWRRSKDYEKRKIVDSTDSESKKLKLIEPELKDTIEEEKEIKILRAKSPIPTQKIGIVPGNSVNKPSNSNVDKSKKTSKNQKISKPKPKKKANLFKVKVPFIPKSQRVQKEVIPQLDGLYDGSFIKDLENYSSSEMDSIDDYLSSTDDDYYTDDDQCMDAIFTQLDGGNDEKPSTSQRTKLDLKKLGAKRTPPKLIKPIYKETDSEDDFQTRSPFTKKNIGSPSSASPSNRKANPLIKSINSQSSNKVNLKRQSSQSPTKSVDSSRYFQPKLDIRKDIVSLVKGRINERKHSDRAKNVRKVRFENVDDDSDYAPEAMKKKKHDDDEFVKKTKVKKRLVPQKKADLRVFSSDEDKPKSSPINDEKKNKGVNIWVEVYLESEEKWISVDVIKGQVHCVKELYSRATHPVSYILAWDNNNNLKDISKRYCPNWNTVTRKLRAEQKWVDETLKPFKGKQTARDKEEDEDLARQQLEQPLPKVISEYKNHPLYVLKRHLLKFQALYPPEPTILGFVRKEPVYSRDCVFTLHSREIWVKHAKVVKPGEQPYKIVKSRPKYDRLSNTCITDKPLEIFGNWQIQDYVPPTAENGVVPRNAYGNVELFKQCMLPKKTVHLQLPGLHKVAKKMNIDCAPAVVGFDFHSGFSHPTFDGYVVCEEFSEVIVAAWYIEQEESEKREKEKVEKRVYGNWRKLIKGLLIRERLKERYDFGPTTNVEKNKTKSSKLVMKKRKICDDDSN